MKRKTSLCLFLGLFDALAVGSMVTFLATTLPEMDWSYGRSYVALATVIAFFVGILAIFGMVNVQALYPTLDAKVNAKTGVETLLDTPKNKKFFKIMNVLKWIGIGGMLLGIVGWVLTQVVFGVN